MTTSGTADDHESDSSAGCLSSSSPGPLPSSSSSHASANATSSSQLPSVSPPSSFSFSTNCGARSSSSSSMPAVAFSSASSRSPLASCATCPPSELMLPVDFNPENPSTSSSALEMPTSHHQASSGASAHSISSSPISSSSSYQATCGFTDRNKPQGDVSLPSSVVSSCSSSSIPSSSSVLCQSSERTHASPVAPVAPCDYPKLPNSRTSCSSASSSPASPASSHQDAKFKNSQATLNSESGPMHTKMCSNHHALPTRKQRQNGATNVDKLSHTSTGTRKMLRDFCPMTMQARFMETKSVQYIGAPKVRNQIQNKKNAAATCEVVYPKRGPTQNEEGGSNQGECKTYLDAMVAPTGALAPSLCESAHAGNSSKAVSDTARDSRSTMNGVTGDVEMTGASNLERGSTSATIGCRRTDMTNEYESPEFHSLIPEITW